MAIPLVYGENETNWGQSGSNGLVTLASYQGKKPSSVPKENIECHRKATSCLSLFLNISTFHKNKRVPVHKIRSPLTLSQPKGGRGG